MASIPKPDRSLSNDGRYRLLIESITDYAIYMLDAEGIVTSWNAGAQRFKGYEAPEILGRHFGAFYTATDQAADVPARNLSVAAREGRFEGAGWRIRKDGGRFWAHVVIDPVRDAAGGIVGYAKITRDLTERKVAEEALRRSEQQFRLLVQSVTDYAIFMLDADGRVASWNLGAERIKGFRPEEIIGEHFSRFYTAEDRAAGEPERALAVAAREGRFEREGLRVRKDGARFWAHVVIDPIRDLGDGTLIGFAKVTRDITERKEAQRALGAAREALFQAQKIEAVGQLTGGIAHDFNNLLMAVLGSLELLRKRMPQDERLLRLIDNAVMGAQRGAVLTQRLLSFARRQELDVRPIDLPDLVRGIADLLQRSLGPGLQIETRFPLSLRRVRSDPNQLEAALLNLVTNARDAMPDGGLVTIAAREASVADPSDPVLAPGDYVCLSVVDRGEGMDEETTSRATEPFFTTKGVGKGTGLGLSMVDGLAAQSGGRLILKSGKGEGTTVELWLPVVTAEPAAAAGAAPDQGEPGEEGAPGGRGLAVLVVDDDPLVLMNTAAMVEDLGHTAHAAASAGAALGLLRDRSDIELVITDQAMPQMTGVQLAAAIRGEWPETPVVLVTGYARLPPGTVDELPRLSKPFSLRDLARTISSATSARR